MGNYTFRGTVGRMQKALGLTIIALGMLACASIQHDPVYNGFSIVPDSVQITISNTRIPEVKEAVFRMIGNEEQFMLGRVPSTSIKVIKLSMDRFHRGECFTVIAHFTSYGDITYPQFCWSGQRYIDISINEILSTSTAWAH